MDILLKWRNVARNKKYVATLGLSLLLLFLATQTILWSSQYTEAMPAAPLPDVLHTQLPLVDLGLLATYGFILSQVVFFLYFILKEPQDLPKALTIYSIFVLFRAVFISITTLGAPATRIDDIPIADFVFEGLYFTKDLFPSGHTALPFLGYLLIKHKTLRRFMLFWSLVMGATVLLLHVHYSIDVLGAFFVAYGSLGFYKWCVTKYQQLLPLMHNFKKMAIGGASKIYALSMVR